MGSRTPVNMVPSREDPSNVSCVRLASAVRSNYKHTAGPNIRQCRWRDATYMVRRVVHAEYIKLLDFSEDAATPQEISRDPRRVP